MTHDPQPILEDPELADSSSAFEPLNDIDTLRGLLFGQQASSIERLKTRLSQLERRISTPDSRVVDTSEILAEAVEKRLQADAKLGVALKPVVVEQFRETSRDDPEVMADALYPILGPAIRKMIISILSPDRNAKKRTYRVEQLFLIHNATGLPVSHVSASLASTQDADMVSGMLSAIQSFVKDAFDTDEFDTLNTLQLGDVSVWIEWGPEAVLAAVVRGIPPIHLRDALQIQIEDIHRRFASDLSVYDGDASSFDSLDPELTLFLESHDGRLKNRLKNLPVRAKRQLLICGLLVGCALVWFCHSWFDSRRWANYVADLENQPGIVITDQHHGFRQYSVTGLRDPMASDPLELLASTSINPDYVNYQFEPYQAMHPDFTLERANQMLSPPQGVQLRFENPVLLISGVQDRQWGAFAKKFALSIAGIDKVIVLYSGDVSSQ